MYNFPVSLQPLYTKQGAEAPKVRAVVNESTGHAIATVSTKYSLLKHQELVDKSVGFVRGFGIPEERILTSRNADKFAAEYTYKEKTAAVGIDDVVGLRVYVENSYNGKSSAKIRIGALRLKCLNGMMLPHDVFSLSVKHAGKIEIEFPNPEDVLDRFRSSVSSLSVYKETNLTYEKYTRFVEDAVEFGLVNKTALDKPPGQNAWDLYNQFTYNITHESKMSELSKINKLNRVALWMEENVNANTRF